MVKDNEKDYIIKTYLIKKLLLSIEAPVTILLIKITLTKPSLLLLKRLIPK